MSATKKLLWVYYGSLIRSMDRSTWLETAVELSKYGWSVTLFAEEIPEYLDIKVQRVLCKAPNMFIIRYLYFHYFLVKFLIKKSHDIDIVLFSQKTGLILLLLIPLLRLFYGGHPKYVLDSRTVPMDTVTFSGKKEALLSSVAHKLAGKIADGQTSNTVYMAKVQKVPSHQLLGIWPAGVNVEKFRMAVETRSWLGINGEIRLIYIGALCRERNLLGMCEAVEIARSRSINVVFTLVGDGPQRKELELFAEEAGSVVIRVLPPVPSEQVPQVLALADIGVIPFPDTEIFRTGTPIKQFEYMAAGMPLLVTRVVCHTSVIGNNNIAFWAKDATPEGLADAIVEASFHKDEFGMMGKLALALSRNFTWEKSALLLSQALGKLIIVPPSFTNNGIK